MVTASFRSAGTAFMMIVYIGLSVFMLFIAYRTYRFTGGFNDVGTVAVVVGMVLLVLLILRLGYRTVRRALD